MGCNDVQNTCEWKFVKTFVRKERQDRYLEMLKKGNQTKFLDEMRGRMWRFLDPQVSLHCRHGITLTEIEVACPQLKKVSICYVTNFDTMEINQSHDTQEYYTKSNALYASSAVIITFIPGELAIYSLEEYVALCYQIKGFAGILATLPQFKDIVDKSWDTSWGY